MASHTQAATDRLLAVGSALLALALYLRTLAPGPLPGDPGEFQVAAPLAGLAHPTGYPLYLILGWLWTRLPLGSPAWEMNLLSAMTAALVVGLFYLLALQVTMDGAPRIPTLARRMVALGIALALAANPTLWSQSVVAEVYALHALLAILILLTILQGRYRLAGLFLGLGLAHHRTTLLLLPGVLAFLWLAERRRLRQQRWFTLLALVALPQLLYLYIPLRAPRTPWLTVPLGPDRTLWLYDGFLNFVLGTRFVGEFLGVSGAIANMPKALTLLSQQFTWPGLLLAVLGLAVLTIRRRWVLLALTGLTLLAQLGFNLFYGIGDVYVLYILVYLILLLWLAIGVQWLLAWLPVPSVFQIAISALTLVLPLWLVLTWFGRVAQSSNTTWWDRWQAILAEPLPQRAILISNDRDEMVPLLYAQQIEGQRPDVTGLYPLIVSEPGWLNVAQVGNQALSTGRPTYLIKPMPGLELEFDMAPAGSLVQLIGKPSAPQHAASGSLADVVDVVGYSVSGEIWPGAKVVIDIYWRPRQPLNADYTSFVHLLDAAGKKVAQSDHRPGGNYYPSSLWQPGEMLRDRHRLMLPARLQPGGYRLLVGMYTYPPLERLGQAVVIGEIPLR
ncbi:MAG TPA: DUF2723 domain-containing protein [Anaerolineae bacterium]|nr:DUF2723 domain-containing protein [Anaerolineae bacterium]